MKLRHYISGLVALLLVACSTDDISTSEQTGQEGYVVLQFGTNSLTTRTSLNTPKDLQHIEEVRLLIYNEDGFYKEEKIDWPSPEEIEFGDYSVKYPVNLPVGTYSFIAVGLDNGSKETYDIDHGKKPEEAIAKLSSEKGKNDIARSELFAGKSLDVSVTAKGRQITNIEMKRRVCGFLMYVKNIPGSTTKIQIEISDECLYTSMPLAAKENEIEDCGQEPLKGNDAKTLLSVSFTKEDLESTTYLDADGNIATKQSGTIKKGVYFLPITKDIKMYLKCYSEEGKVIKSFDILLPTSSGSKISYPLLVNHLYSVAQVQGGDDDGGDNNLVITVYPNWDWKGELEWAD